MSTLALNPPQVRVFFFFFINDTATTEIYTLSLHDALQISILAGRSPDKVRPLAERLGLPWRTFALDHPDLCEVRLVLRSEEHTSELQSQSNLVCRLPLEKKKKVTQHSVLYLHLDLADDRAT